MNKWMVCAIALALAACATGQPPATSTPKLDENFGKSLNAAKQAQKVNQAPSQKEVSTSAQELAQPYDNMIKGKSSPAALEAPIPIGGK